MRRANKQKREKVCLAWPPILPFRAFGHLSTCPKRRFRREATRETFVCLPLFGVPLPNHGKEQDCDVERGANPHSLKSRGWYADAVNNNSNPLILFSFATSILGSDSFSESIVLRNSASSPRSAYQGESTFLASRICMKRT